MKKHSLNDISDIINSMSIEEKIGQLFMVGFNGTKVYDILPLIEHYYVGNIILFSRNIVDKKQLKQLIKACKRSVPNKIPLMFAIDQEGGLVVRLTKDATVLSGNMALCACDESLYESYCDNWAKVTATELKELGITLNLAPVLDVNNLKNPGIGARAFSDDPNLCAKLGSMLIKSMHKYGLIACAKHFPGKGSATLDAHLDLPVIDLPFETLDNVDLLPFKKAIESGVEVIMSSHVIYRGIGDTLPATLSHKIQTQILRKYLNFDGILITDDMEMGAIKNYYEIPKACFKSFMAGADIILICHSLGLQVETIKYFLKMYHLGKLKITRINQSLERILKLKFKNYFKEKRVKIDYNKNLKFAQELADNSITLVSDENKILKNFLHKNKLYLGEIKKIALFEAKFQTLTQVEEVIENSKLYSLIKNEINNKNVEFIYENFDVKLDDKKLEEYFLKINNLNLNDALSIVISYNGHLFLNQIKLANYIIDKSKLSIVIAVRNPYDLMHINKKACQLATYSFRNANMESIFKVIFKNLIPKGHLPVKFN